jgi:hypothetical protein
MARPVKLKELLFYRRLFKEGRQMRDYMKAGQWLNVLVLVAQVLNATLGTFPALALNPWVLAVQAALGALLPGFASLDHKIAGTVVIPKEEQPAGVKAL